MSELLGLVAHRHPMDVVGQWMEEARGVVPEHEAMALATVDAAGELAVRMVLCRMVDQRGVVFFTNEHSAKGRALLATGKAAATIFHQPLGRQIRVVGNAVRVSAEESDAYFASRPRGHQIGAWASAQSTALAQREDLERAVAETEARFAGTVVPRPPYWGGFRIEPTRIELWHQQRDRLHDRVQLNLEGDNWVPSVLQP